jgi:hypothetical protein
MRICATSELMVPDFAPPSTQYNFRHMKWLRSGIEGRRITSVGRWRGRDGLLGAEDSHSNPATAGKIVRGLINERQTEL